LGKLLVLSHLIALCDAKATTTSHAHEVSERPPQKWFFASLAVLLGANAWCFAACALFCCARRLRRRYARFTDEAGPSAASPSSNTAGTELRQGAARRESTGGEHPGVR
jgi:hypothetical protein